MEADLTNRRIANEAAYNRRREQLYIQQMIQSDREYLSRLKRLYKEVADQIEKEIIDQYMRYAGREGLNIKDAYKKASAMDVEAFAEKAKRYVEEKNFSPEANEEFRAYNLKMRISRMELMKRNVDLETATLEGEERRMLEDRLDHTYRNEIERQAGILRLEPSTRERLLKSAEEIVNGDFQGAPFSARIWANREELTQNLKTGLERSLFFG